MSEEDRPLTMSAVMQEIQILKDKLKNDDYEEESLFQQLEKSKVIQECRDFHDSNIVTSHPRRFI